MAAALGVNQRLLFTAVFALGAALAGLGGALAIPREPASLEIDLGVVSDAFVVVVVGGLGSIPGAFLAALLIGDDQGVLHRPGLLEADAGGRVHRHGGGAGAAAVGPARPRRSPRRAAPRRCRSRSAFRRAACSILVAAAFGVLALAPLVSQGYPLVLLTDILVFALFAVSLHFIMGPGGMASFGHAAYFGLGAYGAGAASCCASLLRWRSRWSRRRCSRSPARSCRAGSACASPASISPCSRSPSRRSPGRSRSSGMRVTGGSNGLIGVWPAPWLASKHRVLLSGARPLRRCAIALALARARTRRSATRCARRAIRRCAPRPSASTCARTQWAAFIIAGTFAGVAGALFAFSKGSISPETLSVPRSVDAPGHGAARRRADAHRPAVGRGPLHLAGGLDVARVRLLARRASAP